MGCGHGNINRLGRKTVTGKSKTKVSFPFHRLQLLLKLKVILY